MNNLRIKKGDTVTIIAGKDKGKSAQVAKVDITNNRVLLDGLNLATNFVKARTAQEKGGIITKAAPINASNVMVVCPTCNKATKVNHKVESVNGVDKNIRTCKKCGASLDVAKTAKVAKKATKKKSVKKETAEIAE